MSSGGASRTDPASVLVVGEALIDIVDDGARRNEHVGGSPANVALGLGRLGADVALLTQIARDERGRRIAEHVAASGVRVCDESWSLERTSTALARIGSDGAATYAFDIVWDALRAPERTRPRVVHTGSIATTLDPGATAVRDMIAGLGADEVTFDPNIRAALVEDRDVALAHVDAMMRIATAVKLSDEDAAWLFPADDVDAVLDRILAVGPRLAAVTLGAEGAVLATAQDRVRVPPVAVDVVDTIGAGDTFMATMIHALASRPVGPLARDDLDAIGRHAVDAAAVTVSRAGADLPWAAELDRA